jgi:F-type H+-transporting ATPase subunit b
MNNGMTLLYPSIAVVTPEPAAAARRSEMDVSGNMVLLTWLTFLLATYILYKMAWKPILAALDKRESEIKKSLDEASKARAETAKMEDTQKKMIGEADDKAREILDQARKAAGEVATMIETKAKKEAGFLVENARREIELARDKATAALRRESAELAVELAQKVIRENLDAAKNRDLVDRLMKDL